MSLSDYIEKNRLLWNNKTPFHLQSDFYDVDGFVKGKSSLSDIEQALLGDVSGKKILHLQCHFGQDTISLARMGAIVTGVDLSDKAIEQAHILALRTNVKVDFICCDVFDLPQKLNDQFDLVFTSFGVVGWLPDLDKWGKVITAFLKPGGKFVFAEFHPVVWMFDDDFEKVAYTYLNSGPIIETETGTYADVNAPLQQEYVCWNHGMSEVLNSLIKNGLEINSLEEYDYSPHNCFKHTIEIEKKKFRIRHLENKIPMVYAVLATKKAQ